ncbi:MAG: bifunctional hydroxymethylpyrimidine kinase/phosphomethylpyrimidine kinase [Clostridiales bacterium]|nr:bifunctional hydroxymethylpyrimidine kinase/phosphomethylpyrimidine kinase [Clostridiales bacterium]
MNFAVIGGINLDVTGVISGETRPGDSNPGHISLSPGGVGRNIAAALTEQGQRVLFVTALPGGLAGDALKQDCLKRGMDISRAVNVPEGEGMYLSLHSRDGEMLLAVNDMSAVEQLSHGAVKAAADDINRCGACVVDANLSEEALRAVSENVRVPLIADTVSVSKCARLKPLFPLLRAFKPNLLEASFLTGESSPSAAARALVRMGIQRVYISLGKEGLYFLGEDGEGLLPPEKTFACQTTGAGDCLCAGLAIGAAQGLSAKEAALLGQRLAFERLSQNEIKAQFTAP